jgi:hypothetical protein
MDLGKKNILFGLILKSEKDPDMDIAGAFLLLVIELIATYIACFAYMMFLHSDLTKVT